MSNIVKAKKTSLVAKLGVTDTSIKVKEFISGDSYEKKLDMTDFGNWFVVVVTQAGKQEMILCDGITQNSDGTATLHIAQNGRNIRAVPPYDGSASGLSFNAGAELIVSNDPKTLSDFARKSSDNYYTGKQTYAQAPKSEQDATDPNELARLSQVQQLATGTSITDRILITATVSENVSKGQIVYFDKTSSQWKLADATNTALNDSTTVLAIATEDKQAGQTCVLHVKGRYSGYTNLSSGSIYYIDNTPGGISSTPGDNKVSLGIAISQTELLFSPRFDGILNSDQKAAAAGADTKAPSEYNKFVTQSMLSNGATYTANTISFDAATSEIRDSANGFLNAGFEQGQEITITGSANNNITTHIVSVTDGVIKVDGTLTDEAAGASVTIAVVTVNKIAKYDNTGKINIDYSLILKAAEDIEQFSIVDVIPDVNGVVAINDKQRIDIDLNYLPLIYNKQLSIKYSKPGSDTSMFVEWYHGAEHNKGILISNNMLYLIEVSDNNDNFTLINMNVTANDVVWIDKNTLLATFVNNSTTELTAQIITIDENNNVTTGSQQLITAGSYNGSKVDMLSNNIAAIITGSSNTNYYKIVIANVDVNNQSVSLNTQASYYVNYYGNNIPWGYFDIASHRDNSAIYSVYVYSLNGSYFEHRRLTFDGANITTSALSTDGTYYDITQTSQTPELSVALKADKKTSTVYIHAASTSTTASILRRIVDDTVSTSQEVHTIDWGVDIAGIHLDVLDTNNAVAGFSDNSSNGSFKLYNTQHGFSSSRYIGKASRVAFIHNNIAQIYGGYDPYDYYNVYGAINIYGTRYDASVLNSNLSLNKAFKNDDVKIATIRGGIFNVGHNLDIGRTYYYDVRARAITKYKSYQPLIKVIDSNKIIKL